MNTPCETAHRRLRGLSQISQLSLSPRMPRHASAIEYRFLGRRARGAFLVLVTTVRRRWAGFRPLLHSRRVQLTLMVTTCLIATNWGVFIWAVANGRRFDLEAADACQLKQSGYGFLGGAGAQLVAVDAVHLLLHRGDAR